MSDLDIEGLLASLARDAEIVSGLPADLLAGNSELLTQALEALTYAKSKVILLAVNQELGLPQ